jgi:hypothetical protein
LPRHRPGPGFWAAAALAALGVAAYLASSAGTDPGAPRDPGALAAVAPAAAPLGAGRSAPPPGPSIDTAPAPIPATAPAPLPAAGGSAAVAGVRQIDADVDYSKLPPDEGLVSPMARADELPPEEVSAQLECMRMMIPGWGPGHVSDPVQRVRNYLLVAAVPDVYQTGDLERWIPLLVAERLRQQFTPDDLVRILHQIATHPAQGDLSAAGALNGVCFDRAAPSDTAELRERVTFYALKLLGRQTGRIPDR